MRRQRLLTALILAGLAPLAAAQTAPRITLEQAMADPDWIGNAVEQASALTGLARHHEEHGRSRLAGSHRRRAAGMAGSGPRN